MQHIESNEKDHVYHYQEDRDTESKGTCFQTTCNIKKPVSTVYINSWKIDLVFNQNNS